MAGLPLPVINRLIVTKCANKAAGTIKQESHITESK